MSCLRQAVQTVFSTFFFLKAQTMNAKQRRLRPEALATISQVRQTLKDGKVATVNERRENGFFRTYSLGMTNYDVPEIIIYGYDQMLLPELMSTMYEAFLRGGDHSKYALLEARQVTPEVAQRILPAADYYFPQGFRLLQLTWPDPNGHHPGDPQFETLLAELQPRVWGLDDVPDSVVPDEVLIAERRKRQPSGSTAYLYAVRERP